MGALIGHITGGHIVADDEPNSEASASETMVPRPRSFQPMNVNFGLFPPMDPPTHDDAGNRIKGKDKSFWRKRVMSRRALADHAAWLS